MRLERLWRGEVAFCLEGNGLNGLLRQAAAAGIVLRSIRRESRIRITGRRGSA